MDRQRAFDDLSLADLDVPQLQMLRTLGFGASGVCVAIILVLAQIGLKDQALHVALGASAVALPSWLFVASAAESYLFTGRRSLRHLGRLRRANPILIAMLCGSAGVATALIAVLSHLSTSIAWIGFAAGSVALVTYVRFNSKIARSVRDLDSSDAGPS